MKYDYIVIGSGAGGAITAARLSENPDVSVLLLEAGPDYPNMDTMPDEVKYGYGVHTSPQGWQNSQHRWHFTARASAKAPPQIIPRGRVIGGSTSVNAQIFLRGVPEDYDSWAAMGNDEWTFEKLMPYFRKLENDHNFHDDFHGTDGPIIVRRFKPDEWLLDGKAFYDGCRAIGFADCPDHNDPDSTGVGPTPMNNPERVRWSTAIGYLNPARHRLNLTIRANCFVHRILFEGKRAAGVRVESGNETFDVFANEVVLSAGAIQSPQILMLSGIGPSDQLSQLGIPVISDLPGVGKNLRDHPQVHLIWRAKPDFQQYRDMPRLQFTLRYTATGSDLRNDMLIHPISYVTEDATKGGDPEKLVGIGMTCTLNLAIGTGELLLDSRDPHIQPYLDYNYLAESFDRERLRECIRYCLQIAEQPVYADIIRERLSPTDDELASDDALDEYMMQDVGTSHHSSGTCKMGPSSDPMAVVDQHGKVYGVEGLRVVDASIMPDCIRANTNVTTMMIGEKLSADIIEGR